MARPRHERIRLDEAPQPWIVPPRSVEHQPSGAIQRLAGEGVAGSGGGGDVKMAGKTASSHDLADGIKEQEMQRYVRMMGGVLTVIV